VQRGFARTPAERPAELTRVRDAVPGTLEYELLPRRYAAEAA
jgi:hypothetical protein